MTNQDPSVEELRAESERTRALLADNVRRLRQKVSSSTAELKTQLSPDHLKRQAREYVREERDSLVRTIQDKARENPLQAAAIGAAAAYPALGLLRAVPIPLWLIGAGLFLTTKRGKGTASNVQGKVSQIADAGSEKVTAFATDAKSAVNEQVTRASASIQTAANAIQKKVGELRETSETVEEHIAQIGVQARTSYVARTKSFVNLLQENALLVAGVGAAVGAFIAASIPASEAENRLFGTGSDRLKDMARREAGRGIETISEKATEAASAAGAALVKQGLDTSGISRAVESVIDSARTTAEHTIATATSNSQNSTEGNPT